MKLLMVTQDFPPVVGGIQTYSYELARRFAAACERFEVVAPADRGHEDVDRDLPYPVHRLPVRSDRMAAATILALPALCRGRGFDATFHAQWYTAHAGLLARKLGFVERVFVAAHGRELLLNVLRPQPVLGAGYDRIRVEVLRRVDRFFAVSRYTAGVLEDQGVAPARITVVPNGVDPDRYRPSDGNAWRSKHGLPAGPLIVTLCRLVPRKGVDTVLRSLPAVARAVPSVHYAIVGSGPDRERLERIVQEVGEFERVTFVGRVPDEEVPACLSAADVFAMPARSEPPDVEGFGLVFLEANACGRAVVGARAGGVPDAIVPGETGLLVEPDDLEGLAEALVELLTHPDHAARLGRQGRARVEAWCSWDRVAEKLLRAMTD
jgi:phosphatidylinositol alpha-1,6-mannosyltransferase